MNPFLAGLWAVYLLWNLIVFVIYAWDKHKAKAGEWRTPEKTLLLLSACMGGLGAFLAMRIVRHKTKHLSFSVIVPLTLALELALMAFVTWKMI